MLFTQVPGPLPRDRLSTEQIITTLVRSKGSLWLWMIIRRVARRETQIGRSQHEHDPRNRQSRPLVGV